MTISEQDLVVIRAWATSHASDGDERLSLRADIDGHHVIMECVRLSPDAESTETTIAQLRFMAPTELWSLFSVDATGALQPHAVAPAERVSTLLAAIDADECGAFWR